VNEEALAYRGALAPKKNKILTETSCCILALILRV